jgi:hypothetical protein
VVRATELEPAPHSSPARTPSFIEEVRGDDPGLASDPWIEERELEAGGLN